MPTKLTGWFVTLALAGLATLALPSGTRVASAGALPHPTAAAKVEPHPEINRAMVALERAKFHLQRAAHDFGGHRVAAIAAIDRALVQLRRALRYDRD